MSASLVHILTEVLHQTVRRCLCSALASRKSRNVHYYHHYLFYHIGSQRLWPECSTLLVLHSHLLTAVLHQHLSKEATFEVLGRWQRWRKLVVTKGPKSAQQDQHRFGIGKGLNQFGVWTNISKWDPLDYSTKHWTILVVWLDHYRWICLT